MSFSKQSSAFSPLGCPLSSLSLASPAISHAEASERCNSPIRPTHSIFLPVLILLERHPDCAPVMSLRRQKLHHTTLSDHPQHSKDEKLAGTFQLASLKTTLGTTKSVLLICMCGISEAELPSRCLFRRTTFSPVRWGATVNRMCGREKPRGCVHCSFPLCLTSLLRPLPPTLLMVSAITGNSALPAKENQGLSDRLSGGWAREGACEEG